MKNTPTCLGNFSNLLKKFLKNLSFRNSVKDGLVGRDLALYEILAGHDNEWTFLMGGMRHRPDRWYGQGQDWCPTNRKFYKNIFLIYID